MTVKWRENNRWWSWESCLIQSASVMLELDSTPVESLSDGLPVLTDPQGAGFPLCLSPRGRKSERWELRGSDWVVRPVWVLALPDTGACRGWRGLQPGPTDWATEWVGGYQFVLLSLVFSSQAEGRLNLEHSHYCSLFPPSISLALLALLQ